MTGIGLKLEGEKLRQNSRSFFIFFAFDRRGKHADRNYCCSPNRWAVSPRMNFQGKPHTIYRRRNFFRHKQLTTRPSRVLLLNCHKRLQGICLLALVLGSVAFSVFRLCWVGLSKVKAGLLSFSINHPAHWAAGSVSVCVAGMARLSLVGEKSRGFSDMIEENSTLIIVWGGFENIVLIVENWHCGHKM